MSYESYFAALNIERCARRIPKIIKEFYHKIVEQFKVCEKVIKVHPALNFYWFSAIFSWENDGHENHVKVY